MFRTAATDGCRSIQSISLLRDYSPHFFFNIKYGHKAVTHILNLQAIMHSFIKYTLFLVFVVHHAYGFIPHPILAYGAQTSHSKS